MNFFRLASRRLVNVDLIRTIDPPNPTTNPPDPSHYNSHYKITFSDGSVIVLNDDEAKALLNIVYKEM